MRRRESHRIVSGAAEPLNHAGALMRRPGDKKTPAGRQFHPAALRNSWERPSAGGYRDMNATTAPMSTGRLTSRPVGRAITRASSALLSN